MKHHVLAVPVMFWLCLKYGHIYACKMIPLIVTLLIVVQQGYISSFQICFTWAEITKWSFLYLDWINAPLQWASVVFAFVFQTGKKHSACFGNIAFLQNEKIHEFECNTNTVAEWWHHSGNFSHSLLVDLVQIWSGSFHYFTRLTSHGCESNRPDNLN